MTKISALVLAAGLAALGACDAPPPPAAPQKLDSSVVINEPVWIRRPDAAAIASLRPAGTAKLKVSAIANLWCRAQADGTLTDCQIDWQDPPGLGFGEAALEGAPMWRMEPADEAGAVTGRPVEVRMSWRAMNGG